jgi:hypothetical protein
LPDDAPPPRSTTEKLSALHQRFEESAIGRAAISCLIVGFLLAAVIPQLPEAEISRQLKPIVEPVAVASGVNQYWGMFAPDPPGQTDMLAVHVTMADGSEKTWTLQRGDWWMGGLRSAHWQGAMHEAIWQPVNRARFAEWAVNDLTEPGERAVRVRMVVRTRFLSPTEKPHTETTTILDEDLTGTP